LLSEGISILFDLIGALGIGFLGFVAIEVLQSVDSNWALREVPIVLSIVANQLVRRLLLDHRSCWLRIFGFSGCCVLLLGVASRHHCLRVQSLLAVIT